MTKTAWIFGDSHAGGSGMYPGKHNDLANEYTQSYPCLISRDLGYNNTKNYSMPGYGNDSIFRWVIERHNDIGQDDIVILCWSELSRTEHYSRRHEQWLNFVRGSTQYHQWWKIRPNEFALNGIQMFGKEPVDDYNIEDFRQLRYLWNDTLDRDVLTMQLNFIKNVVAANTILKQKTSNIMNFWSLVNTQESPTVPNDYHREQMFESTNWPVGLVVFRQWALDNGFQEDEFEHLPWPAHRAFADYVVTSLDKKL